MPGIAGIFGIDHAELNQAVIGDMIKCMICEPSYTSGTHLSKELGLCVGWVSQQNSFSDCMPLWNEAQDVCLIFTGEDFRDADEISFLKTGNRHKYELGNATYLVHLYEEMGLKFIEKLNGWFSGVLVDLREQKVMLFNDRYGLGRIYYHENKDGFYFASEAKALLRVLPELRRLDPTGLAETFSCGCVLQNRTLFTGISLLPGGSLWTYAGKRNVKKEIYFDRRVWEDQPLLDASEHYAKLKETFARILPRYLSDRRRVAMSLTGGLDGRMIMAWTDSSPGELPCYTFGGQYRDCADVKIARRIARLCGQSHETIPVNSRFFAEFPSLAEKSVFVSDGTMDVTGSVELYVNKIASRIAPVRLTGNYGSEIVRGNVAFRPHTFDSNLLDPDFEQLVRDASVTYDGERQGNRLSFIAFKQVPWHHYARFSVELSQLTVRSPYLDNDLVSLMYQASSELSVSKEPSLRLIADGNADLSGIPTDRGVLFRPKPIVSAARHLYQEFTVRSEYAYDYGMPQWLARMDRLFTPLHLEKLFLGRHKFYHFRIWYRKQLSEYVRDILLDPRTRARSYFRGKHLEKMVNDHIKGHNNFTEEFHQLLTIELVQRLLVEREFE